MEAMDVKLATLLSTQTQTCSPPVGSQPRPVMLPTMMGGQGLPNHNVPTMFMYHPMQMYQTPNMLNLTQSGHLQGPSQMQHAANMAC